MKRLALGVAVVLVGGVAYGAAPGSDGAVHACSDNASGALRVIDPGAGQQCRPGSETALSWNQTGPPGPAGPGIPAGVEPEPPPADPGGLDRPAAKLKPKTLRRLAAGAEGEPTKAFSVFNDKGGLLPSDESSDLTVLRLPVPAGRYVAIAKGSSLLASGIPEAYTAGCRLQIGADSDDTELPRRGPWVATVVGRLKKPGAIELRCWTFGPEVLPHITLDAVTDIKVTAINVAAISNAPA